MRSAEVRIKLYRGVWCAVRIENGQTKRHSLRTENRAQAERNFQEYLRQYNTKPGSIGEILDAWEKEKTNLKSLEDAKRKLRPVRRFFENLLPDHITREICREYAGKRNVSNTTIRNELALLRAAVNWFDPNNKSVFDFPPADPPKDHYLTLEEYIKLLDSCKAWHVKLFIIMALHTGARSNAILDLTWDRVDFERKLINLAKGRQTNKRRALVPINDILLGYLKVAKKWRTTDYVIEYGGKRIVSIRKSFGETAKRAGIEASPHILRHTAAMVMAESGVDMQEISQFLGHTGRSTTERVYARFSPTFLQRAASSLFQWHRKGILKHPRFGGGK
jgi:integrase